VGSAIGDAEIRQSKAGIEFAIVSLITKDGSVGDDGKLAAVQRADKNIAELLEDLNGTFHRLRQNGIDEKLFDVISDFGAWVGSR
jgi:F0F1-type ATP synthase gamma subunit